jgi:hypothetical protein
VVLAAELLGFACIAAATILFPPLGLAIVGVGLLAFAYNRSSE